VLSAAITPADLGLRQDVLIDAGALVVESASGLIADDLAAGISRAASETGRNATSVLTWLANRITVGTHTVPYSLVTAIGNDAAGDARLAALLATKSGETPPIVLNEWAARELDAAPGKNLDLEYLRWADEGRLVTEHAKFQVAGVIPMSGLALDRRLAPDYPGITAATNLADWDPPFPIDLSLVESRMRSTGTATERRQRHSFRSRPASGSGGAATAGSHRSGSRDRSLCFSKASAERRTASG
jgi:hypothetical protein